MMEQGGRLSSTTTTTLAITPMNEETVSYKKGIFMSIYKGYLSHPHSKVLIC